MASKKTSPKEVTKKIEEANAQNQEATNDEKNTIDLDKLIEVLKNQPVGGTIEKAFVQVDPGLYSTTISVLEELKNK